MAAADFEAKMKAEGLSDAAIAAFKRNYDALVSGETGFLPESTITPVESLPRLDDLRGQDRGDVQALLKATAVLKLNGAPQLKRRRGLGTSMGLEKAKSLLVVKDGHTFLDLIARQVKHQREKFGSKVRFILMNSFSTSEDTKAFLSKDHADLLAENVELLQNKSPKVDKATLKPAAWEKNKGNEWCPPGHGDIYAALTGSGMLDALIADGIRYLFVSNSDNLGATLDLDLLAYFAREKLPFCMECAERTAADKKGGHLAKRASDGTLLLRESAQCPKEDEGSFQDVSKHKFFNTNNLWVNLAALKERMAAHGGSLPLPLIKNEKTVDPRDKKSTPVFQLETAMGAAIECFPGAGAVVVPRSRFAPVKTCGDLFLLRSDAYVVTPESTVELLPGLKAAPMVKLDDNHYKLVDQLDGLVAAYPSLKEATSITVKGPVKFSDAGVVVKGSTTFTNAGDEPKAVAPGEYKDVEFSL